MLLIKISGIVLIILSICSKNSDAEPLMGIIGYIPTTTETQIYVEAASLSVKCSVLTITLQPSTFPWIKDNCNTTKICTPINACGTFYALVSTNLGLTAQGPFSQLLGMIVDFSKDGTCSSADFTEALNQFNLVTSYMPLICTYFKNYVSVDVGAKILELWTAISTCMNDIYLAVGSATNMTSQLYEAGTGTYLFKPLPSELVKLLEIILKCLKKISELWDQLAALISKLVPSLIISRECHGRSEDAGVQASSKFALDLFLKICEDIGKIFGNYNQYCSDLSEFYSEGFSSFLLLVFDGDDLIVVMWKETLVIEFRLIIEIIKGAFKSTIAAYEDSAYFSREAVTKSYTELSVMWIAISAEVILDSVTVMLEKLSGYNPCEIIKSFKVVGLLNIAAMKRSLCLYSRLYRCWLKHFPIMTKIITFFGPYFNALFAKCYSCIFLANKFSPQTDRQKVVDCLKEQCFKEMKGCADNNKQETDKVNKDYKSEDSNVIGDCTSCMAGEANKDRNDLQACKNDCPRS